MLIVMVIYNGQFPRYDRHDTTVTVGLRYEDIETKLYDHYQQNVTYDVKQEFYSKLDTALSQDRNRKLMGKIQASFIENIVSKDTEEYPHTDVRIQYQNGQRKGTKIWV